ncbi:hypothetical protein [Haladaptatus sp. DYF46]|uniref:hypothetical protein n=1 Tax=Haladaptatus sp. DYF46 TaxID=2886041 RepID=UPI001E53612F|nr:hypothetical protein [Haladaptatus sp. DYF46]
MRSRRSVLSAIGSGLILSAGCISQLKDDPKLKFESIGVFNKTEQPHELTVRMIEDGKTVFRTSERVKPARNGDPGGHNFDQTWPTKPASYELHAKLEEKDEWIKVGAELADQGKCFNIRYMIDANGKLGVLQSPCSTSE